MASMAWRASQRGPPEATCPPTHRVGVQEWILHTTGAGPALQVAVLDAVRGQGPRDQGRCSDTGRAETTARPCPNCYEALVWPGGRGHALHAGCLAAFAEHRHGAEYCPVRAVDSAGYPRPSACPHGHDDRCGQECGERCPHNLWSGLTGCFAKGPGRPLLPPPQHAPRIAVVLLSGLAQTGWGLAPTRRRAKRGGCAPSPGDWHRAVAVRRGGRVAVQHVLGATLHLRAIPQRSADRPEQRCQAHSGGFLVHVLAQRDTDDAVARAVSRAHFAAEQSDNGYSLEVWAGPRNARHRHHGRRRQYESGPGTLVQA